MSGLLALLDDVAAIAKVAATSVDDVVAQASKAGTKAAGAIIDDAAVTPKYMSGFSADRELPIVWKIARGSVFNKIVILLPIALLLSQFAPWAIAPLLMLGGAYLCFEGAEKVLHWLRPQAGHHTHKDSPTAEDAHLEEDKVKGAIKTDFILSAEIMTIVLSALPAAGLVFTAAALGVAGLMITAAVYGAVALIVKMDDVGLHLAGTGRSAITRAFGRAMVRAMPYVLTLLTVVGTAAMLWVGGAIIVHGLEELGLHEPGHSIKALAEAIGQLIGTLQGAVTWGVQALIDGLLGLAIGIGLVAIFTRFVTPLVHKLTGKA